VRATFKRYDPREGTAECVTANGVRVFTFNWKLIRAALAEGCEPGQQVEIKLNKAGRVRAMRPAPSQ